MRIGSTMIFRKEGSWWKSKGSDEPATCSISMWFWTPSEGAIQAAAAIEAGIGVLVTRDAQDHKKLEGLQVLSPELALAALALGKTSQKR